MTETNFWDMFNEKHNPRYYYAKKKNKEIPLPPLHRARKRPQQKNIIGESKSSAKLLNLPPRILKLRNKEKERQAALDELAEHRKKRALKKRKREEEQAKKKKAMSKDGTRIPWNGAVFQKRCWFHQK